MATFDECLSRLRTEFSYAEDDSFSWGDVCALLILKLSNTDSLNKDRDVSNATQIQLTGESVPVPGACKTEDFFPTLTLNTTFERWRISIPTRINRQNINILSDIQMMDVSGWRDDTIQIRRRLLNKSDTNPGNPTLQICYGTDLLPLREKLRVGDYIVVVKRKGANVYEAFGVKANVDLGNGKIMLKSNATANDVTVFSYSDLTGSARSNEYGDHGQNILLYGVPGSGKSFYIKNHFPAPAECIERVVFHPEYTYSDFVGQILPKIDPSSQKLKYEFTPGPFTKILKEAVNDKQQDYYLIIEEINRGNAPAIFGEIFQLLDRDDSGISEYGISNFDIATEVYGNKNTKIRIPGNLWILATMNTSDQNVFTLDTAFQRRWVMKLIENKISEAKHAKKEIEGTGISWGVFAETINEAVVTDNSGITSAEDKRLGAYFARESELKIERFPEKVLKYLWDDAFKMNRTAVFSEKMTSLDLIIETYVQAPKDRLHTILRLDMYQKMMELMRSQSADQAQPKEYNSGSEADNE